MAMDAVDLANTLGSDISGGRGHVAGPVDLSEVDFEWVERLRGRKDARRLAEVILALEQDEGFPDLLKACKKKMLELDPTSAPALVSAPVSRSEKEDMLADLASWSAATKAREASLREQASAAAAGPRAPSQRPTPPVRGHTDSAFEDAPVKPASAGVAKPTAQLGQELDASTLLPEEVAAAALLEKEKGNECFRAREYDESVVFYTRSLHLSPTDPAVLNNRALAFLRLQQLDSALNDVALVLQQDPSNWKALWRRGQVHEARLFLERAIDDMKLAAQGYTAAADAAHTTPREHPDIAKNIRKLEKQLLEQEPNHPYVQHLRKGAAATTAAKQQQKQEEEKQPQPPQQPPQQQAFKRMAIAEVDEDEDEDEEEEEEEETRPQAATSSVTGAAVPPSAATASTAVPPASGASSGMHRMAITEVDDDDGEDEEEIVAAPKPAASTAAPPAAAVPAAAPAPVQPQPKVEKKAKAAKAPAFHSKSGGMTIELVSDEEEEEEAEAAASAKPAASAVTAAATPAATAPAASKPAASAAATVGTELPRTPFVMPPVPLSSAAFQRDWSELRGSSRTAAEQFGYLRRIEPAALIKMVSGVGGAGQQAGAGAVDGKMFASLLSLCASHYLRAAGELPRAVQLLSLLSGTARFSLNLGLAGGKLRGELKDALHAAAQRAEGGDEVEGVPVAALQELAKKY